MPRGVRGRKQSVVGLTNLLHDTSLSLGEGDVTTRLVLDELNLDLSTLTAALLIIVVVVVSTSHRGSGSLGASRVGAVASEVITWRRVVKTGVGVELVSHGEFGWTKDGC